MSTQQRHTLPDDGTVSRLAEGSTVLRAPTAGDAMERARLGRCSKILRGFGIDAIDANEISQADAAAWLVEQRTAFAWMIEADGALVGTIRLHSVDPHDRRAQLAVGLLDPAALGRGIGSKAVALVLDYAFADMALHRLSLRVLASNRRAIRCYERAGFVLEGREREAAATDWGREDDLIYGLLASDRR